MRFPGMVDAREREDASVSGDRQPDESRLADPRLRDLSLRDWRGIFRGAIKRLLDDHGTMLASALAYSTFFAIPSILLVVVGAFTLVAGPDTISSLMHQFSSVMPAEATTLLQQSLSRLDRSPSSGVAVTLIGLVLAVWSMTGAMTTYMTALDLAYERTDRRSFARKRLASLALVMVIGLVFLLVAVLLIFGPSLEQLVASHVGDASGAVGWIWWIAEWPILIGGLLVAFTILLDAGPDVARPQRRLLTPGSALATTVWLVSSGAFAYFTSNFGSYNKTWGSLAAVIIMLTWLWLAALALLLGAELNAETERALKRQAEAA
jgi:membrane protein